MPSKSQKRDSIEVPGRHAAAIRRKVRGLLIAGLRVVGLKKRKVLLTFDDGPHPVHTLSLLNDLKRANIQATFFVVGKNLESSEGKELLRRAAAEGHQIGNHTYSHPYLTELQAGEIREEILRTEKLIGDLDRGVKILRPPYGAHNPLVDHVARELGYELFLWNVDSLDWQPDYQGEGRWVDHAVEQIAARDRSIVLAHDIHATTVTQVGTLIARIRELSGSRFIKYSDVLPWNMTGKA